MSLIKYLDIRKHHKSMNLFVYEHCPYCIKARMIFGAKDLPVNIVFLDNDDEKSPIEMIGKKMVPILEYEPGKFMPESMDIIQYIDETYGSGIIKNTLDPEIVNFVISSKAYLYELCMPRWVQTNLPEFKTQSAIDYFINKKSSIIPNFEQALANTDSLLARANTDLEHLESLVTQLKPKEQLTYNDFELYPMLKSLSIVKNIKFGPNVTQYIKDLEFITRIPMDTIIAI